MARTKLHVGYNRYFNTYGLLIIGVLRGSCRGCRAALLLPGLKLLPGTQGLVRMRLRCLGDVIVELTTTSDSRDVTSLPFDCNVMLVRD